MAGKLVFSPSDLIRFVESPYASWLDRQYLEAADSLTPDPQDPLMRVLARRGGEHETAFLAKLRQAGHEVREIARDEGADATRAALEAGVAVVYQACLQGNGFAGYADFLIRADKARSRFDYAVWDTKLARQAKPYFIIQLCCYADMLEAMTGHRPSRIGVVLGDGEERGFRTDDFFHYYQRIRAAFLGLMARFPEGGAPAPEPAANHGRWAGEASRWLAARDDLSLVAGITRGQIAKLREAGVDTLTGLASRVPGRFPGISDEVVTRLHRQAALQLESRDKPSPAYLLLPPPHDNPEQGLAALPPADPKDIYFDMEGYPAADDWLEYLVGVVTVEAGKPAFKDWWAHDAKQERRTFEDFVDWVFARWREHPGLHVYHYAAYEPNALKRLMSKYGTREDEVDALLRAGVFIDLFSIVRRGVMVGEPAYSLKNVEHLYRPARSGDVTDAGASVAVYDEWCESGQAQDWHESPLLKAIRDYNEDDCVSTWELAEWLRARQAEAGLAYVHADATRPEGITEQPLSEAHEERRQLAQKLMATLPPDDPADPAVGERRRIQELLGWLVEFHRREDKPMWWRYFARQEMTVPELWDDLDCLADLRLADPPGRDKQSLLFAYRFDPDQDSKLHEGSKVGFVPDLGFTGEIDAFDPEGDLSIKVSNRKLANAGLSSLPEQTSLIPYEYINPKPIPESISSTAEQYLRDGSLPPVLADFLCRRPPRLKSAQQGSLRLPGEGIVDAAIRLARDLDQSCLCLQGPPGAGKTYTAAKMILALIDDAKSVGVTSNSHKAILNLMQEVCKQGGPGVQATKVGGDPDDPVLHAYPQIQFVKNSKDAVGPYPGAMVGGTAWFFSQPGMVGELDYLFVDEAGQVSVANLVGVAPSASNLILLGDQMQLGQPIQGSHPGESGLSVLDYYLEDHATIPDSLGLFLDTSWRMHPDVCRFISEAVYEGRLMSEPKTANRVLRRPSGLTRLVSRDAGLLLIPVEHVGNVQGSDEEVAVIRQIVADLAECEHTDKNGATLGKLDIAKDMLFVAPYNLQVRKLRKALPAGARVGSVDKFQGQEAPVVIVSMCASPGEFGSRGMQFVLDENRLNVAISRAQSLAIVVGDPRLVETPCGSIADMKRLNLYCWIQAVGGVEGGRTG